MADEEVKGMVVKLAMEDGSFQDGIKNLNRQMKVVQSDFKASVGNVKTFGDSLDGLKANSDKLSKSMEIQSQIVEKYQKKLDDSKTTLDRNVESQNILKRQLDAVRTAYDKSKNSVDANADTTQRLKKALDELQGKYDKNNEKIRNSQRAVDNNTISLNNAKSKLNEFGTQLNDTTSKIDKANAKLKNSNGGFESFKKSISDSIGKTNILGVNLGDLGGSFGKGGLGAIAMGGAVAGLTMKFVELAMQGIQKALQALKEFIVSSVDTASSLVEVKNVVDTTFGADNKIKEFAEDSASAFNLSAIEANKFAGIIGAVLTPTKLGTKEIEDMSRQLTQLSGDMGSFWNVKSEEAFNALRSALTGETEPMKRFGVVMTEANLNAYALSQGLGKTTKEMTEAEKATLRFNYILENTKTAQGDATKTTDTYANANKKLKLEMDNAGSAMGEGMLQPLANLKVSFASMMKDAKPLLEFVGKILGTIIDLVGTLVNIVIAGFKPFMPIINKIVEAFNLLFGELNKGLEWLNKTFNKFGMDSAKTMEDAYNQMSTSVEKGMDEIYEENVAGCDEVLESIVDLGDKSYSQFEDMYSDIQSLTGEHYDTLKAQADEYNNEYKTIDDALTQYVRDGVREKEKEWDRLNEKNANKNTKEMYLAKAKYLAGEEKRLNAEVAKDRDDNNKKYLKLMESSWEQQNRIITKNIKARKTEYEQDYEAFKKNEELKTKAATEEQRKRSKLGTEKGRTLYSRWLGDSVPKYATGTKFHNGGLALVGEKGAELVDLPGGSKVYTNRESKQMMQQNEKTPPITLNNVTIQANNPLELWEEIQLLTRRGGIA